MRLNERVQRRVVLDDARGVIGLRPRRDHDQRDPEAVAVIARPEVAGTEHRRDVVGLDRGRGRDVVVVAAVFVVGDEHRGATPRRRVDQGVDDLGDEALAGLDVLRVLLRRGVVVRVDKVNCGRWPAADIGEELDILRCRGALDGIPHPA